MQPILVTATPGAEALAQRLENTINNHPGSDADVVAAVGMLAAQAIGSFPPAARDVAFAIFMSTVASFLERTP